MAKTAAGSAEVDLVSPPGRQAAQSPQPEGQPVSWLPLFGFSGDWIGAGVFKIPRCELQLTERLA